MLMEQNVAAFSPVVYSVTIQRGRTSARRRAGTDLT